MPERPSPLNAEQLADELDLLGMKARTLALELRASPDDPTYLQRAMHYLHELHSTVRGAVDTEPAESRWSRA